MVLKAVLNLGFLYDYILIIYPDIYPNSTPRSTGMNSILPLS
jgi:hypothetical protein